jgi:hypothetical protein
MSFSGIIYMLRRNIKKSLRRAEFGDYQKIVIGALFLHAGLCGRKDNQSSQVRLEMAGGNH